MALLQVNQLSIHFGGVKAVQNVSFSIDAGIVYAVIGPNGAGKTTLFNLITGIYTPTGGTIELDGESIGGKTPNELAQRGVARTFQNLQICMNMSAIENVMVGAHLRIDRNFFKAALRWPSIRRRDDELRREAAALMRFVGLQDDLQARADSMPYGALKRLEIACALAMKPRLIFLDEPAAGLNTKETQDVDALVRRVADSGITVVLVEHNMKMVMNLSDRILVLDYIVQFEERLHYPKEDEFLFRCLRLRSPEVASTLDSLAQHHRDTGRRHQTLRAAMTAVTAGEMSGAALATQLRHFTVDLKSHILTEEKQLLPLAHKTLLTEDWLEINRAFHDSSDPIFGEVVQAEFRELYHRIVSVAPESLGLGGKSEGHLPGGASPAQAEVLLQVQGLESCYGRIKALKGISIEVRRGETVALVGANGAGKTTFLRTLSGVQPMSVGRIFFDGEDISRLRPDKRMRRGICQSPEGRQVFGPLSIEDNLRLGAYTQPRHQVAGTLSGGQQQMLAIGRALMGRPRLLLLDEPSMGLAPLLVQEVFDVIKTLKSQGITILLVEHNALAALDIADRGYVLETGSVTLTGTGTELVRNDLVRVAYLGM